jgi:hypothetical protein
VIFIWPHPNVLLGNNTQHHSLRITQWRISSAWVWLSWSSWSLGFCYLRLCTAGEGPKMKPKVNKREPCTHSLVETGIGSDHPKSLWKKMQCLILQTMVWECPGANVVQGRETFMCWDGVISLLNSGDVLHLAVDFFWLSSPLTSMT